MNEAQCAHASGDASREDDGARTPLGFSEWLCLAATPTYAILALLTALFGGSATNGLCLSESWASLGGMAPMYLLMSAFHSPPWLRLMFGR